jgi:O-antigen/teichoic acid export membrane protein
MMDSSTEPSLARSRSSGTWPIPSGIIVRNAAWNLLATLTSVVFSVATSSLVARMLGPQQQGVYSYVLWLIGVLAALAGLGLPSVALKYLSEYLGKDDREQAGDILSWLWRRQLALGGLAMVGLMVTAPLLADPDLRLYLLVAALGFIPLTASNLLASAIQGAQEFGATTRVSLLVAPLQFALSLAVLKAGLGITGLVGVGLIATIVTLVLLLRAVRVVGYRDQLWRHVALPSDLQRRIWRYCLNLLLVMVIDLVVWQRSEVFFLRRFASAEQIAFYGIAFAISEWGMRLPGVFTAVLLPTFSGQFGRGDAVGLQASFTASMRYLALVALPVSWGGAAVTRAFIALVYGEAYLPAAPVAAIMLGFASLGAVSGASASLVYSADRPDVVVKVGLVAAVLNVTLALLFVPSHGALGAAVANSAAQMFAITAGNLYVVFGLKAVLPLKALGKIATAAASCALVAWGVTVAAAGLVYLAGLRVLHAVEPEDVALLARLAERLPRRFRSGCLLVLGWLEH